MLQQSGNSVMQPSFLKGLLASTALVLSLVSSSAMASHGEELGDISIRRSFSVGKRAYKTTSKTMEQLEESSGPKKTDNLTLLQDWKDLGLVKTQPVIVKPGQKLTVTCEFAEPATEETSISFLNSAQNGYYDGSATVKPGNTKVTFSSIVPDDETQTNLVIRNPAFDAKTSLPIGVKLNKVLLNIEELLFTQGGTPTSLQPLETLKDWVGFGLVKTTAIDVKPGQKLTVTAEFAEPATEETSISFLNSAQNGYYDGGVTVKTGDTKVTFSSIVPDDETQTNLIIRNPAFNAQTPLSLGVKLKGLWLNTEEPPTKESATTSLKSLKMLKEWSGFGLVKTTAIDVKPGQELTVTCDFAEPATEETSISFLNSAQNGYYDGGITVKPGDTKVTFSSIVPDDETQTNLVIRNPGFDAQTPLSLGVKLKGLWLNTKEPSPEQSATTSLKPLETPEIKETSHVKYSATTHIYGKEDLDRALLQDWANLGLVKTDSINVKPGEKLKVTCTFDEVTQPTTLAFLNSAQNGYYDGGVTVKPGETQVTFSSVVPADETHSWLTIFNPAFNGTTPLPFGVKLKEVVLDVEKNDSLPLLQDWKDLGLVKTQPVIVKPGQKLTVTCEFAEPAAEDTTISFLNSAQNGYYDGGVTVNTGDTKVTFSSVVPNDETHSWLTIFNPAFNGKTPLPLGVKLKEVVLNVEDALVPLGTGSPPPSPGAAKQLPEIVAPDSIENEVADSIQNHPLLSPGDEEDQLNILKKELKVLSDSRYIFDTPGKPTLVSKNDLDKIDKRVLALKKEIIITEQRVLAAQEAQRHHKETQILTVLEGQEEGLRLLKEERNKINTSLQNEEKKLLGVQQTITEVQEKQKQVKGLFEKTKFKPQLDDLGSDINAIQRTIVHLRQEDLKISEQIHQEEKSIEKNKAKILTIENERRIAKEKQEAQRLKQQALKDRLSSSAPKKPEGKTLLDQIKEKKQALTQANLTKNQMGIFTGSDSMINQAKERAPEDENTAEEHDPDWD
ncbi:MAG: hypothetical protein HYX35_05015 [Proteobacteria bacterium]|nr:hypothetical protein [Pseudomonadota bacterium]